MNSLLYIPPGRKGVASTGWMAGIALVLATFGFWLMSSNLPKSGVAWPATIIMLLIGFGTLGLVSLGLAAWWIKTKLESGTLRLTPTHISLQRSILGWTRNQSLPVVRGTCAALEEAYAENNKPIHRVAITSGNSQLHLATTLSYCQKRELVQRINAFFEKQ